MENPIEISVDNIKGTQVDAMGYEMSSFPTIYISHNNMIYKIQDMSDNYFDQILSTFKFTD